MAILAECPVCHRKASIKNKRCKCGTNLDAEKKSKKVTYHIVYRVNGKQTWKSLSSFEGVKANSIEDARTVEGSLRKAKKEGKIKIFEFQNENTMTFCDLTRWYLNLERVKSLRSCWRIKINLQIFNREFGDRTVGEIRASDLENYQVKRKTEGKVSCATIDQELGAIRSMLNVAVDNDLLSGDCLKPFKRTKRLLKRNGNARKRILGKQEFEALCEKLPKHTKGILSMAFYTGMRRSEITGLTWDRVDLRNRVIHLRAEDTKTKEARDIPICPELHQILIELGGRLRVAGDDSHVFTYKGKPIRDVRRAIRDACKEIGIPYGRNQENGFTLHDLRHTFNTNMRKAGVPESVIMSMTGHTTREMFLRYDTVDQTDTRKAVNQFSDFLKNVNQTVSQEAEEQKAGA